MHWPGGKHGGKHASLSFSTLRAPRAWKWWMDLRHWVRWASAKSARLQWTSASTCWRRVCALEAPPLPTGQVPGSIPLLLAARLCGPRAGPGRYPLAKSCTANMALFAAGARRFAPNFAQFTGSYTSQIKPLKCVWMPLPVGGFCFPHCSAGRKSFGSWCLLLSVLICRAWNPEWIGWCFCTGLQFLKENGGGWTFLLLNSIWKRKGLLYFGAHVLKVI